MFFDYWVWPLCGRVKKYDGSWEKPEYSLWELTSVTPPSLSSSDRRVHFSKNLLHTMSTDDWKALVQSDGDLSKIGIELKKNEPVLNFDLAFPENN